MTANAVRDAMADERAVVADAPALPSPPVLTGTRACASRLGRASFRALNARLMGPMLKAGLGPWMGTPLGGWILLLRVRGRRTGLLREVPLSYLVTEGAAWVMAGFGPETQWYRNLLADPAVEVLLPGRARRCHAAEVLDPVTRARIIPQLVKATGMPGYLTGADPFRASAVRILEATAWVPLIRLDPVGEPLVAGPDDPGGFGWVWRQTVAFLVSGWALGVAARALIRRGSGSVSP